MANALSKSQIAATIAEENGISKKQAVQVLDTIANLAYKRQAIPSRCLVWASWCLSAVRPVR